MRPFSVVAILSGILILGNGLGAPSPSPHPTPAPPRTSLPRSMDGFFPVHVHGTVQWLLIRGRDVSKPVLLCLHGGPGHSLIPFAHEATRDLETDFVVVYWDQRGTGRSYHEDIPRNTMTIDQFVADTHAVTHFLKTRFRQERIFLLGHSWGSVLGVLTVQRYPEDYEAYIGVGQVVHMAHQQRDGVLWLKERLLHHGTPEEKRRIPSMERHNFAPRDLLTKYGGSFRNISEERIRQVMRDSPYSPDLYTKDLYRKGVQFAKAMWLHEVIRVNFFESVPELAVPVFFFLGREDHVAPPRWVESYAAVLKAPTKEIFWFERSGHRMDIEEPERYRHILREIARKHARKP